MATNVWGTDYRMCVSERAFDDYQTKEEQRKLLQAYRRAGWAINDKNTIGVKYE